VAAVQPMGLSKCRVHKVPRDGHRMQQRQQRRMVHQWMDVEDVDADEQDDDFQGSSEADGLKMNDVVSHQDHPLTKNVIYVSWSTSFDYASGFRPSSS